MSECKCLQATFSFSVFKRLKPRFWNKNRVDYFEYAHHRVVTIHGESMNEIEQKKDEIVTSLKSKYPDTEFVIKVTSK